MTTRYECSSKPLKCPACGAITVASIFWGYPSYSEDMKRALEEGRIVLGGCCVTDEDPVWQCTTCDMEIFKRKN